MEKTTLFALSAEMAAIEEALYENGGEMTEEIEALYSDTQENIAHKIDGYNAVIGKCKMHSNYLAEDIKRKQALKKVYDNTEKRIKEHLLGVMVSFDIKTIEGMDCKATRRKNAESLVIEDESMLTDMVMFDLDPLRRKYPWLTFSVGIDKAYLKEQYKQSGVLMDGCHIEQGESVVIK